MGSGYNLPPGCYESDLPGWNDVEVDIRFECDATEDCGDWDQEVTVDSRGGHEVEAACPVCGATVETTYDPDYE
jgi:hypothetical protein